jgi:hypothetical protein
VIAQLDAAYVRAAGARTAVRLASYFGFEGRPAAAPGQFVNPLVLAHLRAVARRAPCRAVERPVFVVGMGRSGTTVLGLVLGTHPDVGFLNEPKALWHVIRDDEDIIGTYSSRPGRLRLDACDADPEARRRAHALYAWYARVSRSDRVVDKYPELVFRSEFVRALFPDAHFVIVSREPWSTIASVSRWSAEHDDGTADWWGVHDRKWNVLWSEGVEGEPANADLAALELGGTTDSYERAAVEWLVTMRAALAAAAEDPQRSLLTRYEDLTADPTTTIGALLERLDLRRNDATLRYAREVLRPARVVDPVDIPPPLRALVDATARELCEAA